MRHSSYLTILTLFFLIAFFASMVDSRLKIKTAHDTRQISVQLVKALGLTDLSLFTEASYTRHLSQADRHTAFQNHPMALDHFPSGGIIPPPAHLKP